MTSIPQNHGRLGVVNYGGSQYDPNEIEDLIASGMNQNQVAAYLGTSRQNISKIRAKNPDAKRGPRAEVRKHYPFTTDSRFCDSYWYKLLRWHGEYMATGGTGMDTLRLKRLDSFYRKLEQFNAVLEFDPAIPPGPNDVHGGFRLTPRLSSDGDLIIRVNEHARLTDRGRILWTLPPSMPEV